MFHNPVLERLREERAKHIEYIQTLLAKVDEDQRDLVDAETASLESVKQRIAQLTDERDQLVGYLHQ